MVSPMVSHEQFEAAVAEIKSLKRQITGLRNRVKDLEEQVESINLSGFQEQISQLDKQLTRDGKDWQGLYEDIKWLQLKVAEFLIVYAHAELSMRLPKKAKDYLEQFTMDASSLYSKLETASLPLSDAIAFYNESIKEASKYGVKSLSFGYPKWLG